MRDHVQILAWLYIVMGVLGCLVAILVFGVFAFGGGMIRVAAHEAPGALLAAPILWILGTLLFVVILLCAIPGIAAGIGLLDFRPWARIVSIVIGALYIFNVPIGTALGVYALWVLLTPETEDLFRPGLSSPSPSADT